MNTIRDGVWSAAWLRCLVVLLVGSLLLACSSSANEPANTSTGGAGAGGSDSQPQANDVSGRVSYPDGVTPIVGADVSIEVGGKDHSAKSGADGKFLIKKLPAGTHAGVARKGIFSANFTITVVDGQVSDAGTIAIDPSSAKLAAVTGTYDSIQDILTELDFEVDIYDGPDGMLMVSNKITDYDAVFVNCDTVLPTDKPALSAAAVKDIRAWLAAGGKLYVSDWASANAYALDADMGLYAKYGPALPAAVPAITVDEDLAAAVGEEVKVRFDLGAWAVIVQTGANTNVHMKLSAEHLAEMTEYEPPGDGLPLMISASQGSNGGVLFFTSFHNEAQATATMKKVLSWVVLFDF